MFLTYDGHTHSTANAALIVGTFPTRFASCIFLEGFSGFGFTYAADFGAVSFDMKIKHFCNRK